MPGLYLPENWDQTFTNQLTPIAQAYEQAPIYDPNAEQAWHELAQDSAERADQIRKNLNVTETDNPEPYANAQDMLHDIHHNNNFVVSNAHSEHPIWTPDQNVNFRIVHDVFGHGQSGGDFSWLGENKACGAHFPLLSPNAQQALFSECIGQTAYANQNHGFGPQKTSFIHQPFMTGYSAMPEGGFCHRHIRHGIYNLQRQSFWANTNYGAMIHAAGDTYADRVLSRALLESELRQDGIKLASIPVDYDPNEAIPDEMARASNLPKNSHWNDIMQKAKRIIDSGGVQLLRNGYNNIVAQIQGDHGQYQNEISRDDPNSRAITGWQCECPWDQFAFQRTRQWKKYEGRPCAHTLAAYWKSLATPLDDEGLDVTNAPPGGLPQGPGMGPQGETQPSLPGMTERPEDAQQPLPLFEQAMQGPMTPALQNAIQQQQLADQMQGYTDPQAQGVIPPSPMEGQDQMMEPNMANPGETAPGAYVPNMVSIPGARQPSPYNPVQNPSTLSSWQYNETWKMSGDNQFENGDMVRLNEETMGVALGKSEEHGAGQWRTIPQNAIGEVLGQDPTTGWLQAHFPLHDSGPMEPFSVQMFLEPGQVTPANNIQKPGPFIKRR